MLNLSTVFTGTRCLLVIWNFNFLCNLKEVCLSLSLSLPFLPFLFSFLCQTGAELSFAVTISEPLVCKGPQGQLPHQITLHSSASLNSWFHGFASFSSPPPLYTRPLSSLYSEQIMRRQHYFHWKLIN